MHRRRLLQGASAWGALGAAVPPSLAQSRAAPPLRMAGPALPLPEARQFQTTLLRLALRKAGEPDALELLPAQRWMRQVRELQAGHLDVAPLPALEPDPYVGHELLRVNVPLRGGLLGVRPLLVMPSRLAEFETLTDAEALGHRFVGGYGADWGDLALMQSLGMRLKTAASLAELYEMLRRGEIDYLSRGLNELDQEQHFVSSWSVAPQPVPGVLLAYPLDDCFFVAPGRANLHRALTLGLQVARRDGSHQRLLRQFYGDALGPWGGARVMPLRGYPTPHGLPAEAFEGWRALLPDRPRPRTTVPSNRLVVTMAAGQAPGDPRFRYATALLTLALQRSGFDPDIQPVGGLTQPRQALELARGQLDVGQLPAVGAVREGQALPVALPIRRGLLGLRLLLARADRAEAMAAAPDLETLQRRFVMGHGADWGDLPLMRQAGFRVVTGDRYPGLFRMLEAGRFDFMSRAVSEVWDELAEPRLAGSGGLVVVPRLALFYPLDDFFWVNPARAELAERIQVGMQRARDDGSFERLYRQHYGVALQRAQLRQRLVFRLPQAQPPPGSPLGWYDALERMTAHSSQAPTPGSPTTG